MTGQPGRPQRGKTRPLPRGTSLYTPGATTRDKGTWAAGRSLEQSSARPLVLLHQLPVWVVPLLLAALLIAGLVVPGWIGAVALVLVAAFLGWLAAVSWPRLTPSGRLLRVAAIAGVLVIAGIQAVR